MLVAAGLEVDAADESGNTPLHLALGYEGMDLDAVGALVELGADPNRKDQYGNTAFDLAKRRPGYEDRLAIRILESRRP